MIFKKIVIVLILLFVTNIFASAQKINIDSLTQSISKKEISLSQVYFEIYNKTKTINVDTATHFLHKSIAAAREEVFFFAEKRGLFRLAANSHTKANYAEAITYAKKCVNILPDETYYQCRCYRLMGIIYVKTSELENAKISLEKSDLIAQSKNDSLFQGELADSWGDYYHRNNENEKAIRSFLHAFDIGKEIKNNALCFRVLINISAFYNNIFESEKIQAYLEKAKQYSENIPENNMQLLLLEGRFYEQGKEYQKATEKNEAAIKIAEKLKNNTSLFELLTAQSDLYFRLKNYSKAEEQIKKCQSLNLENNLKFEIYNIHAKIKLKQSQCTIAAKLLEKATEYYNEQLVEFVKEEYFENMTRVKACLGEVDSFNIYFDKTLKSQEALYLDTRVNEVKTIETKYNDIIHRISLEVLQLQNQEQKTAIRNRNIGLVASAVLLAMATFLILLFRKLNKSQKQLNSNLKNEQIKKEKLFTNIAHEFQTPLGIILGLVDKISKSKTSELQNHIGLITKNSNQLSEMTNQILELSKIENASLKVSNQYFSVYDLIHYLSLEYQVFTEQKGINLRISQNLSEDDLIYSDVKKIKIILNNILSNAFKYTERGGEVEVSSLVVNEHFYQINIRDTGRGIPKEEVPYVFDRYYQTENTKAEGGVGIGLAICKAYIKLLKGEISVKSEIGKGSTFFVNIPKSIPRISDDNLISDEEIYRFPKGKLATTALNTFTTVDESEDKIELLIVEDNIDFCKFLEIILQEDYALTFAHNGIEALEYLNENIPDLIITDWMMPSMDGIEFVQKIKETEALLYIPILMLTARNMVSDQMKVLRVGIDDYLSKPFEEHVFKERIAYLLNAIDLKQESDEEEASILNQENIFANSMKMKDQEWLIKLDATIMSQLSDFDLELESIAKPMILSVKQLNRKTKQITGFTAKKYVQEMRYWEARRMLEEKEYDSVKAISLSVGFKDRGNFSRKFKRKFGKYPKEYL